MKAATFTVRVACAMVLTALAGCGERNEAAAASTGGSAAELPKGALESVRAMRPDPSAKLTPLNLEVIDALAAQLPELATVRAEVAQRERRALTALFKQYPGVDVQVAHVAPTRPGGPRWARVLEDLVPAAHAQPSIASIPGASGIVAVASTTSFVTLLAGVPDDARGARNVSCARAAPCVCKRGRARSRTCSSARAGNVSSASALGGARRCCSYVCPMPSPMTWRAHRCIRR
jgi:hypothetical protein